MNIWERLILEFQAGYAMAGPGNEERPEAVRNGIYNTFAGAQQNFSSRGHGSQWPYSADGGVDTAMDYGVPRGPRPYGRGDMMGVDYSGHPVSDEEDPAGVHKSGGAPMPRFHDTWDDNTGADNYDKFVREAMGQTSLIGPFVPYDGLSMRNARNARPPVDVDGNPVSKSNFKPDIDTKIGPNNPWGGDATIPGGDRGFSASPSIGDDDEVAMKWKPPEEKNMRLHEFFDPESPPAESVENPEQTHEKDQTDDEIENKLDRVYGQKNNHDFDDGKESNDDSTKFTSIDSSEDDDADSAGVIVIGDEPAGVVSLGPTGSEPEGDDELPSQPPGDENAQDFQLTAKPEAGEMTTLSQFMAPQDYLTGPIGSPGLPQKKDPSDILAAAKRAEGLVPKISAWDEVAMQIGDAIINFKKTGKV